jgi:glycosyltransferase involved in cell wall biosynthesis
MSHPKNNVKFSVITPVHLWNNTRREQLLRAIESVRNQDFPIEQIEHIIVNDGSTLEFELPKYNHLKLLNNKHEERVIAFSSGFAEAKGEWFVTLDSDDELEPNYLSKCSEFIKKYKNYKMFNFGCKYFHVNGEVTTRQPFEPLELEVGHEKFFGGNIVSGTFIWHRSVYEDLGSFPEAHLTNVDTTEINYGGIRDLYMGTPYDFAAASLLEFPELREEFMVEVDDNSRKCVKELGNPWGQDFYLFYKYTRKYHCKPIRDEFLYKVYLRNCVQ